MTEYKPNSHKYKARQQAEKSNPPVKKKVVAGGVKVKKKSEMRKVADNFISEEVSNIKSYILMDVIIPTIKNTIWDAITNSLDMALYGGSGKARRNGNHSGGFSYDKQYRSTTRVESTSTGIRPAFTMDDIEFDNRGDAERVLDQLRFDLNEYRMVKVSDIYDMCQLTAPYTSNRYGWTSLDTARVVRSRGGWIIDLPRPMAID